MSFINSLPKTSKRIQHLPAYTFSDRVICQRYEGNPVSFWMQKPIFCLVSLVFQSTPILHPKPPQLACTCPFKPRYHGAKPRWRWLRYVRNRTLSEGSSIFDILKQKSPFKCRFTLGDRKKSQGVKLKGQGVGDHFTRGNRRKSQGVKLKEQVVWGPVKGTRGLGTS